MVKKYGQTVLVTQDLALENYLDRLAELSIVSRYRTETITESSNKSTVSQEC